MRLAWLAWYSVDVDEAFSLFWARAPLSKLIPDLLALRGDPHPPGYYAMLKPWIGLVGENEIGLRLDSVFAGIIFVALLYRFGRDLFSVRVGLVAALLAAVNPALVYESLDARMYMPAATFALAGGLALWYFAKNGRWTIGLSAFVFLVAACYHHLAGALAVAGLAGAILLANFPRRAMAKSLAVLLLVSIAYLPYALNAWQISGSSGSIPIRGAPNLSEMLEFLAKWALVHEAAQERWLVIISGLLLWGAVVWGLTRKEYRPRARGYLLGGLVVPLILFVVLSTREPILQPKMLVVTTLAFLLVAVSLPRWIWLVGLLLAFQFWGYANLWQTDRQRENWRVAGQYLQEHVGPNDVVLTHLHFYEEPLSFYYDGPVGAPFGSHLSTFEEVESGLEPYLEAEVLWLVQSGTDYTDPDRLLENWLSERFPLVTGQYPNRITLKGFLLNPSQYAPLPDTIGMDVRFLNTARVVGAWIDATTLAPTDVWMHPPSNWLHVTLYATTGDYQLTLEDTQGGIWGGNLTPGGPAVQASLRPNRPHGLRHQPESRDATRAVQGGAQSH